MANNEIVIKLTLEDGNTVRVAAGNVNKLGKEVNNLAVAQNRAAAATHEHHDKQSKGVIGTANSTRSFSKLASTIGDGGGGLVGAYAALAANVFAVSAAFLALRNAAQVEQVLAGLTASGNRMGVTMKLVVKDVESVAGGLLTLEQAARSSAQVLAAGFSSKELLEITKVAKDASFALGRNMTDSMDRLTRGVIKLEPELLDELGIMTRLDEANRTYARSVNKTVTQLTVAEKRQAFLNAALAEGRLKFGGISDAAGNTTALDKLGATFLNLSNSLFKFLNIVAKPLAVMFSTSPTALAGAMLIFASSIKGQINPGLVNMAATAQKASEKMAELARQSVEANVANKPWFSKMPNNGLKTFTQQLIETGKTSDELVYKVRSVDRQLRLLGARTPSNSHQIDTLKKIKAGLIEVTVATTLAQATTEKANAMTAASTGNLKEAFSQVGKSVNSYGLALGAATVKGNVMAGAMNVLKVSAYATATAAKVAGIAFLEFLPWLGLIVVAIGLIGSGLRALAGEDFEAAGKATKEYKDVLNSLNEKVKEYNRLSAQGSSQAKITIAQNILIGNSVDELIAKYEAAIEAKQRIDGTLGQTLQDFGNVFDFGRTKDVFKLAGKYGKSLFNTDDIALSGRLVDKNYELIATFDRLSKIPGAKDIIKKALGKDAPQNLAEVIVAVRALGRALGKDLADKAKEVEASIKSLDTALADLNRSLIPTTPYDNAVAGFKAVNKALKEYRDQVNQSGNGTTQLFAVLSGLGDNIINTLPARSRDVLSIARDQAEVVQQVNALGLEAKKTDIDRRNAALELLETNKSSIQAALEDLRISEEKYKTLQREAIETANLNKLLQARISKLGTFEDLSGASIRERIYLENEIINRQATQLDNQASLAEEKLKLLKEQIEKEQKLLDQSVLRTLEARKALDIDIERAALATPSTLDDAPAREAARGSAAAVEAARNAGDADRAFLVSEVERITKMWRTSSAIARELADTINAKGGAGDTRANRAELEETNKWVRRRAEQRNAAIQALAEYDAANSALQDNIAAAGEQQTNVDSIRTEAAAARTALVSKELADLRVGETLSRTMAENESIRAATLETQLTTLQTRAKIEAIIAGKEESSIDNLTVLVNQGKVLLQQKLDALEADRTANIAAQAANERAIRDSGASAEVQASAIAAANERYRLMSLQNEAQQEQLRVEYELSVLEALGLKSLKEMLDIEKSLLEMKLQAAELINSNTMAALENSRAIYLQDLKRRGLEEDPISRWAWEKKIADEKLKAAKLERDFKIQIIDLEMKMLRLEKANEISKLQNAIAIARILGQPESIINRLEEQIRANEQLLDLAERIAAAKKDAANAEVTSAETAASGAAAFPTTAGPLAQQAGQIDQFMVNMQRMKETEDPFMKMRIGIMATQTVLTPMIEQLKALGPEGEIVAAIAEGAFTISNLMVTAFEVIGKAGTSMQDRFTAVADVMSAILSTITNIVSASASAKTANIDKEIAAEQKRDGKSAESVAKIAALEKKKEAIAKKAFETNKKLQIAMAIVATASGVAQAAARMDMFPFNFVLAGMIGALGAAQVAIIAGTQYQSSASGAGAGASTASSLSIGSRGNSVDLARNNPNAGGEAAYVTGGAGSGTDASNYVPRGAYGTRSNGRAGIVVGEKGPEMFYPETPGTVVPNGAAIGQPAQQQVHFNIQALDADGVEDILINNKGSIIKMIRDAANANGESFLENVNVATFARPRRL